MIYAGIGSRKTPSNVCQDMVKIANHMHHQGWILRSGGAVNADSAFERGSNGRNDIIYPRESYERPQWYGLAASFHPAWGRCDEFAKSAHARNAAIILGRDLDRPVSFVVCWTDGGEAIGGTGLALKIAESFGIPVFNLWHQRAYDSLTALTGVGRV